jgi:hypothetical protein
LRALRRRRECGGGRRNDPTDDRDDDHDRTVRGIIPKLGEAAPELDGSRRFLEVGLHPPGN